MLIAQRHLWGVLFICCVYIQVALKEVIMEMNIIAQCVRMHENRELNLTDLLKYMQEFKNCIYRSIWLRMKKQGALCDLKGWLIIPSNLECLEGLDTIFKSIS